MVVPVTSLVAASIALGGRLPALSALLNDPDGLVQVLDLSATNALEIGEHVARGETRDITALEKTQIEVEAGGSPIAVMTYEPKRYIGRSVYVMDMTPRQ